MTPKASTAFSASSIAPRAIRSKDGDILASTERPDDRVQCFTGPAIPEGYHPVCSRYDLDVTQRSGFAHQPRCFRSAGTISTVTWQSP